ncbi:DUF4393 domain-containing protein [Vibrio fluvialis]|nr:DUF4393 domain-containing protein [Vibrio fluvialis]
MSDEFESLKEGAVATQEVAKTASNAIDATREFGGFISKFISGPIELSCGIIEDKLRYIRWERQVSLIEKANKLMDQKGFVVPDVQIAIKNAVPLLEYATLEENDDLQALWANLLVNGTNSRSGVALERSFIEILGQLSYLEVMILQAVYGLPFERTQHAGILTHALPDRAIIAEENIEEPISEPNQQVKIALSNLVRVGCLKFATSFGGGEVFYKINPTFMGKEFVRACSE